MAIPGDDLLLDPATVVAPVNRQLAYATCLRLATYADAEGAAGRAIVPDAAVAAPTVSADGRTYAFRIRPGLRFSPPSGAPITAETFRASIERALSPGFGPLATAPSLVGDIVGVGAYRAGRAAHVRGLVASGDELRITLARPAGDFLARLALPFSCAVPEGTPVVRDGVATPLATGGPYYVASQAPGRTVLERNPAYTGSRPQGPDASSTTRACRRPGRPRSSTAGATDYVPFDFDILGPLAQGGELEQRFGAGSAAAAAGGSATSQPRARASTCSSSTRSAAAVPRRPSLRRAVNAALDRPGDRGGVGRAADRPLRAAARARVAQRGGLPDRRPRPRARAPARAAGRHAPARPLLLRRPRGRSRRRPGARQPRSHRHRRAPAAVARLHARPRSADRPRGAHADLAGDAHRRPRAVHRGGARPRGAHRPGPAAAGLVPRRGAAAGDRRRPSAAGPRAVAAYAALQRRLLEDDVPFAALGSWTAPEYVSPRLGCRVFQGAYNFLDLGAPARRRRAPPDQPSAVQEKRVLADGRRQPTRSEPAVHEQQRRRERARRAPGGRCRGRRRASAARGRRRPCAAPATAASRASAPGATSCGAASTPTTRCRASDASASRRLASGPPGSPRVPTIRSSRPVVSASQAAVSTAAQSCAPPANGTTTPPPAAAGPTTEQRDVRRGAGQQPLDVRPGAAGP